MRELTDRALNTAQSLGASYADIRIVRKETQTIGVSNGVLETAASDETFGFGVRVIANGGWGFASSSRVEKDEIDRIVAEAVSIGKASAITRESPVDIGPAEVHVDTYRTPLEIDPFAVPLADKVDYLLKADQAARSVPGTAVVRGSLEFLRETKVFASTEGSYIEQELVESGTGLLVYASSGGETQQRAYPGHSGLLMHTAGYEAIHRWDLPGNAQRVAEEAVALLSAPQCPSGVTTVIIDGPQLSLQIHESCGHPIELDRVFGSEAAHAGTSFLTPEKFGVFQYGSKHVNIDSDSTTPCGLGTYGYDDEGVPAQRTPIISEGVFTNYITSRETAQQLRKICPNAPERSNGAMRASSWNRAPIVRMNNISLLPGEGSLDDLIADTDDGIYVLSNKSWSIDDKRLNFQFGVQLAYEIKNGHLGRMLRNATYTGITPTFWANCDAICGEEEWAMYGTPRCGKGDPGQTAHTGHGVAPARFRNVHVGMMR